jgi:ATP-dependent DNA helicase RecG
MKQDYSILVTDYIKIFKRGRLADFDKMFTDKLPQVLDDKQRKNKVRNLLQKMRRDGFVTSKNQTWYLANS